METTKVQNYSDDQMGQIYDEVVSTFGGNTPPDALKGMMDTFDELFAKTMAFAEQNNLTIAPGFVAQYADQIQDMPDVVLDENVVIVDGEHVSAPSIKATVETLKKDTNMVTKYVLIIVGLLFVAILWERFTKVIAAVGLAIVVILLWKHYQRRGKLDDIKKQAEKLEDQIEETVKQAA